MLWGLRAGRGREVLRRRRGDGRRLMDGVFGKTGSGIRANVAFEDGSDFGEYNKGRSGTARLEFMSLTVWVG